MSGDLVTWLRAQLDEDHEAAVVAAALTRSPWTDAACAITCGDGFAVAQAVDGEPATAAHIARWDPARVLAEVDAKRRIIEAAEQWMWNDDRGGPDPMASAALHLLALPYADRPGYREEWRP